MHTKCLQIRVISSLYREKWYVLLKFNFLALFLLPATFWLILFLSDPRREASLIEGVTFAHNIWLNDNYLITLQAATFLRYLSLIFLHCKIKLESAILEPYYCDS